MEPADLERWPGWRGIRAVMAVADDATCISKGANDTVVERKLDYFVLAEELAPLIRSVSVTLDYAIRPHRAVDLRLGGRTPLPLARLSGVLGGWIGLSDRMACTTWTR